MGKFDQMQAAVNAAMETAVDMTVATKGGTARLLPKGWAFARLIEYIELGNQPQEYQGVAKDPKPEFQIAFALWGAGYQNEDGTPYIIRPYSMAMATNEKAKSFKLFKKMNWKGTFTHFMQMLMTQEAFLIQVVHVEKSTKDKTIVSRLDLDNVLPPIDLVTQQPYNIPKVGEDQMKFFLWDQPTAESWNDLLIEGKYDDGGSKNVIQETLLSATNYEGSSLQALIGVPALVKAKPVAAALHPTTPATPAVAQAAATAVQVAVPLVVSSVTTPVVAAVAQPVTAPVMTAPVIPNMNAPIVPVMTSPSNATPALPQIG